MNTKSKSYRFIINPVSGEWRKTQKILDEIGRRFSKKADIEYEIKYTEHAGDATGLAKDAVHRQMSAVIAVGGDGTMNEVASALIHTDTALGVLPRGSGNGYARSLKIPLKLKESLNHLLHPKIVTVDAGKVNDFYFFGLCGVGFDAEIGARFQEFGLRGPLPYFYLSLKEYFNFDYEEIQIITKEHSYTGRPLAVAIANTEQYGLGAIINPGADYSDGILEVCIVEKPKFYRDIFNLPKFFKGRIDSLSIYKRFRAEEIRIVRTRDNAPFHTDGEPREGGQN